MPEPHDLEVDQDAYQRGLQDGRAAKARARELGAEADAPPVDDTSVKAPAYFRGYRAGLDE